jgi:hypothetical protein
MQIVAEWRAAAALGLGRRGAWAALPAAARVGGLAWLPAVGLGVGVVAVVAARALGPLGGAWGAAAGAVLVLGLASPWRAGAALHAALRFLALGATPPAFWAVALVLGPALGRWALVVQCYGGAAEASAEPFAALAGRAGFREFGWASVIALGAALGLGEAVGLAVAVVLALGVVAGRVAVYRRAGRFDARALDATSALVETSALVLLALSGRLLGAPAS